MKKVALVLLSVSLVVLVSVVGSAVVGSSVFAQPSQPMGEDADLVDQDLPVVGIQDADTLQGYQYFFGVFTGVSEAGDFQAALEDAIVSAQEDAGCDFEDLSDDCAIKYRVTDTRGSISVTDGGLVNQMRVTIWVWK